MKRVTATSKPNSKLSYISYILLYAAGAILVFVDFFSIPMTQLGRLRLYASKGMKIAPKLFRAYVIFCRKIYRKKHQTIAYSIWSFAFVCRIRHQYFFLSEVFHFYGNKTRNKIRVKVKNVVTIQTNMKFHKYYGLCCSTSKKL